MNKHVDIGSLFVIIITLILFIIALFAKGMTQDLLLEAGVFLVSLKLIIIGYKNSMYIRNLQQELLEIKNILREQ
jgi:hypothetical protein